MSEFKHTTEYKPNQTTTNSPLLWWISYQRVLLRWDDRMMIYGAKYLWIYQKHVYLAVQMLLHYHFNMLPDLEHPPISLFASKMANTKSGSIDSALHCLPSTLYFSSALAGSSPLRDILHIVNKLISLGHPSPVHLHCKKKCNFILKFIHRCQSARKSLCVQPRCVRFAVLACKGFKSCTPPDEQLPVLSAPLLSATLLLADGTRSCLLLSLLWWIATFLLATPGVLQPLRLFLPLHTHTKKILSHSLSHLFALAPPAFCAGTHVYNINVH